MEVALCRIFVLERDPVASGELEAGVGAEPGYQITTFRDWAGLRAAVAERAPDAVLLAHGPGEESVERAGELRAAEPLLPILLSVRASDVDGAAQAARAVGPLAVLEKPWVVSAFLPRLDAAVERMRLRRELEGARAALQSRDRALSASRRQVEHTALKLEHTHEELQTATARLLEAEKLAAVGRVVNGIAHEISDQLALVGYAEAIKSRVDSDSELYEFADAIANAQKRLAAAVDQIRRFVGVGGSLRQPEPAALAAVVDEALGILRYDRELRARNIRRINRGMPLVSIDREAIEQVVINLVSNSVLATERGDTIEVKVELDEERSQAVLWVTDPGCGMESGVLERLGEPFFSTRGEKASGLGVGICTGIVEEHGGSIAFCSEVGVGTTARIRLPLYDERGRP